MELKTLFIGIIFAMGIFAIKSGVGLHYLLTKKKNKIIRSFFLSLYGLVYLLLFIVCSIILKHIDMLAYFEMFQQFLKSGMLIHVLMAGGLIVWGIILLKGRDSSTGKSYGWLAMVVPCPICITVIFLSTAFLVSYFPDSGHMAVLWAYLAFMSIVIVTVTGMTLWGVRAGSTPESDMGAAMLLIAVYFFLSVIIMPQFGDVDKIYRIAAYKGEKQQIRPMEIWLLYSIISAFFMTGFLNMIRKVKRRIKWI